VEVYGVDSVFNTAGKKVKVGCGGFAYCIWMSSQLHSLSVKRPPYRNDSPQPIQHFPLIPTVQHLLDLRSGQCPGWPSRSNIFCCFEGEVAGWARSLARKIVIVRIASHTCLQQRANPRYRLHYTMFNQLLSRIVERDVQLGKWGTKN
jgi:hypothetical protein